MTHFHPEWESGKSVEKDSVRLRGGSCEFSRECSLDGRGGAEIMFRDEGGGRDISLRFSAILKSISASFY